MVAPVLGLSERPLATRSMRGAAGPIKGTSHDAAIRRRSRLGRRWDANARASRRGAREGRRRRPHHRFDRRRIRRHRHESALRPARVARPQREGGCPYGRSGNWRHLATDLRPDIHRNDQICRLPHASRQPRRRRYPFVDGAGAIRAGRRLSAGLSARRRRRRVVFWRRHHHASDLRHVGDRRPGACHSPLQRIRSADHHLHPRHAVLGAEPRNGARRGVFWPDHDHFFPQHRGAWRLTYRRCAAGAERLRPSRWRELPPPSWMAGLRRAWIGFSGRDRRRSALCRHGTFRSLSHSVRLARLRASGALAQLSWPGRFDSFPS